jgi:hypothetical protein
LSKAQGFKLCYYPAKRNHANFTEPAMETNLRPMSLGEILDRTAQLYRTNFVLFAGIASVYAGVLLVINLIQIGLTAVLQNLHMTAQLPWVSLGFILLIVPLIVIFAGASIAANNRAVAWVYLGQPATITGAYRSILPRLGRILWMMTIMGFIIYTPFVLIAIGFALFIFIYGRAHGLLVAGGMSSHPEAFAVFGIVAFVFFLLAMGWLVYAILMGLRYSLAIPACVVEDLKARRAIRRSIELSKGSRGRVFLLGLLIAAIQMGLAFLTQGVFLVAIFAAARRGAQPPVWIQISQQIVGFFTNAFIGPMYATGLTLFYYDQRIRKEGFDIEWMMEAAGMTALAAPVPSIEAQIEPFTEPAQPEPEVPTSPQEKTELEPKIEPAQPENTNG